MIILSQRDTFTAEATLSTLSIDGRPFGYVCEDVDRLLNQTDPLDLIAAKKVHGKTAIPAGRYRVVLRDSPKHGKDTLSLADVPGFQFIDVHAGNTADDTEGCQLVGHTRDVGRMRVLQSRYALDQLRAIVLPVIRTIPVYWEIVRVRR